MAASSLSSTGYFHHSFDSSESEASADGKCKSSGIQNEEKLETPTEKREMAGKSKESAEVIVDESKKTTKSNENTAGKSKETADGSVDKSPSGKSKKKTEKSITGTSKKSAEKSAGKSSIVKSKEAATSTGKSKETTATSANKKATRKAKKKPEEKVDKVVKSKNKETSVDEEKKFKEEAVTEYLDNYATQNLHILIVMFILGEFLLFLYFLYALTEEGSDYLMDNYTPIRHCVIVICIISFLDLAFEGVRLVFMLIVEDSLPIKVYLFDLRAQAAVGLLYVINAGCYISIIVLISGTVAPVIVVYSLFPLVHFLLFIYSHWRYRQLLDKNKHDE